MPGSARSKSTAMRAGAIVVGAISLIALLSIEPPRHEDGGARGRSLLTRLFLAWGPHDEDRAIQAPPAPPSGDHWLGTDIQRRDLLSRVLHGARLSLAVGLSAEAIALLLGLSLGSLAGYYGGVVDAALMRAADILLAVPLPILAMAAIAVFDTRSITLVFVVLGLLGWAGIARLVRAQCLSLRGSGFSEAARSAGASSTRAIVRHLLPNAAAPALVAATAGVAGNILTEAWLSFLGLGAQPPAISWGRMIVDAQPEFTLRPWLGIVPGVALVITVLGFVLLGDGLRDRLDPRTRIATHS